MDFLDLCQGLGLALAAGLVIGAVLPAAIPSWGVLIGAAPLAVVVSGLSLDAAGESVWPAIPIGIAAGGLAGIVSRDVVSGAARRQANAAAAPAAASVDAQGGSAGVIAIVFLAAIVLAGLSIVAPPVSLAAAAALAWIWIGRRKREQQKHEGLRVLR